MNCCKTILLICILYYLHGCKPASIVGQYNHISNGAFNTTLNLREDKGFMYEQRIGNIWIISKGTWQIDGDNLLLLDTIPNNVIEVKQQVFLIRKGKLVEIPKYDQKRIILKKL